MQSLELSRRSLLLSGLSALAVPANLAAAACPDGSGAFISAADAVLKDWPTAPGSLAGHLWQRLAGGNGDPCAVSTPLSRLYFALHEHLRSGGIVLFGEIHDNPYHHRLRARFLELFASPRVTPPGTATFTPAVAFEQIRADQADALATYAALPAPRSAEDLMRLIAWDKSSWSKTSDYTPLFKAAAAAGMAVYAADPQRDVIRKVAKEGLAAALPAPDATRLGLAKPLPDAEQTALLAEIGGSHCGMIPAAAQPSMADAQRYRDAVMANTLIEAAAAHGSAILIAGNGHVRTDRAVPWYLRERGPQTRVVSVTLLEATDGQTDPQADLPRGPDGNPAADYVLYTPAAPRDSDPCEKMKSRR